MRIFTIPNRPLTEYGWEAKSPRSLIRNENLFHSFNAGNIQAWGDYFTSKGSLICVNGRKNVTYGRCDHLRYAGFNGFVKITDSGCELILDSHYPEDYYLKQNGKALKRPLIESMTVVSAINAIGIAEKRINLKTNAGGAFDETCFFSINLARKIKNTVAKPIGWAIIDIDKHEVIWIVPPGLKNNVSIPNGCLSLDRLTCCLAYKNTFFIIDNPLA